MKKFLYSIFLALVFLFTIGTVQAHAQYFKFELAGPSKDQCGDFQVRVLINTAGVKTINGDAMIVFENDKLSIDSAQTGNFYTYFIATPLSGTDNKYLVSSWEESIAHAKSTSTDTLFATLNLKAKTAGTTGLSFECTPGDESDTNISRDSDMADIVNCSKSQSLTFKLSGATCSGTTPSATPSPTSNLTPAPTSTPSATPTTRPTSTPIPTSPPVPTSTPRPTVSQLPRAGIIDDTLKTLGLGTLLTIVGILFML